MQWMILACFLFLILLFLGGHDPLYMGWVWYLITSVAVTILMGLITMTLAYIAVVTEYGGNYSTTHVPMFLKIKHVTLAGTFILLNIISMSLVLATDLKAFDSIRHFTSFFYVIIYGRELWNALRGILKSENYLATKKTGSGGYGASGKSGRHTKGSEGDSYVEDEKKHGDYSPAVSEDYGVATEAKGGFMDEDEDEDGNVDGDYQDVTVEGDYRSQTEDEGETTDYREDRHGHRHDNRTDEAPNRVTAGATDDPFHVYSGDESSFTAPQPAGQPFETRGGETSPVFSESENNVPYETDDVKQQRYSREYGNETGGPYRGRPVETHGATTNAEPMKIEFVNEGSRWDPDDYDEDEDYTGSEGSGSESDDGMVSRLSFEETGLSYDSPDKKSKPTNSKTLTEDTKSHSRRKSGRTSSIGVRSSGKTSGRSTREREAMKSRVRRTIYAVIIMWIVAQWWTFFGIYQSFKFDPDYSTSTDQQADTYRLSVDLQYWSTLCCAAYMQHWTRIPLFH